MMAFAVLDDPSLFQEVDPTPILIPIHRIASRDHEVFVQDLSELITYLTPYCEFDDDHYITFEYEPFSVPVGVKCKLTFRSVEMIAVYLMKTCGQMMYVSD